MKVEVVIARAGIARVEEDADAVAGIGLNDGSGPTNEVVHIRNPAVVPAHLLSFGSGNDGDRVVDLERRRFGENLVGGSERWSGHDVDDGDGVL